MVKQTRIIFGIDDITSVRVKCNNCDGELVFQLDKTLSLPLACPQCRSSWSMVSDQRFVEIRLLTQLQNSLRSADSSPVNILFEMEDEEKPAE